MTHKKKDPALRVRKKSGTPTVYLPWGKWAPNPDAVNMLLDIFGYPVAKKHVIDRERGEWFWKLSGKPPNKKENEDDDEAEEGQVSEVTAGGAGTTECI